MLSELMWTSIINQNKNVTPLYHVVLNLYYHILIIKIVWKSQLVILQNGKAMQNWQVVKFDDY